MSARLWKTDLDAPLAIGLTLAELLALLLVGLLFGFAGLLQYVTQDRTRSALPPTAMAAAPVVSPTPASVGDADRERAQQLREAALDAALREAGEENRDLRARLAEMAPLREAGAAAARLNPSTPAAALQDGLRALEALGPTGDPVRAIQRLKADSEARRAEQGELQDYQRLLEAATKADPNAPPAQTLLRALTNFDPTDDTGAAATAGRVLPSGIDESRTWQNPSTEGFIRDEAKIGKNAAARACWVGPSSEAESLFEITLRDDHLEVRDLAPPTRARDAGFRLSRPLVRKGSLTAEEFRKATAPLLRTSVAQGCRYVVQMRDNTAPGSKEAYKMWRSLIEGYFFVKPVS